MRLFVVIGGLIVAVLIAALVAPYFVDWETYKNRFETEASRVLGQEVRVAGNASARLLPFPSVTFADVRVGAIGEPNITIEEFSMDAELAPFLSGEVLIFDMRLVSPVVRLDLDAEGRPIWEWPSQAPVDPAQISLENAQFTDGTLILRDRTDNRQWDFSSLNGSAAAQSLFGPWRFEGEGLVRGVPFDARLSTGNLDRDGFSVRVNAALPSQKIEVTTEGRVAPPTAEISSWYSGTFTLKPIGNEISNYLAEGIFEADGRSLNIEQYRADFGDADDPYTVNGSAAIVGGETPRFDFTAKGNQISVPQSDFAADAPIALDARLTEIGALLASLPFPPIAGNIDLDLPTVVVGNTTIRDVAIKAEPQEDEWLVRSVSAKLPGRTVLEGEGVLALGADSNFNGKLVLASLQPSGLAAWLTDEVDDTVRMLPNAGFAAEVDLSAGAQSFENFELILGDAALEGSLLRLSSGEKTPSIGLSLTGENANFDTIEALAATMFGRDGDFRLRNHDVDVEFDLTNAILGGVEIGAIDAAMRIRGDRTEFDRVSIADIFGASISATGTMVRSLENGVQARSFNVDSSIIALDGAQFLIGLGEKYPSIAGLNALAGSAQRDGQAFRDTMLNIVGSLVVPDNGDIESSASISGSSGGSQLSLTTTLRGDLNQSDAVVGSLMGTIDNDEAAILLSQSGFGVFPIRRLGEGQLRLNMSGSLRDGLSATLALETPDALIATEGVLSSEAGDARYSGSGSVVMGDAEPWLDLFGYIFPSTGLGTPLKGEARINLKDGTYVLSDLNGDVAGNKFSGEVKLNDLADQPKIDGSLRLDDIDAQFLASILTGRYDLADQSALFSNPLYGDHGLDLKLEVGQFGTEQAVIDDATMRLVYRDGALSLRNFAGQTSGGSITGDLEVQNNEGTVLVNGQVALKGADISSIFPALPSRIEATGDVSAAFTGTGKSQEALIGALNGSGALALKNILLPSINLNAIKPILDRADAIGYEITEAQIADIALSELTSGSIEVSSIEVPMIIASGLLSASNISVALPKLAMSADVQYGLLSDTIYGAARLTYDAGADSLAGARPEINLTFSQNASDAPLEVRRDFTLLAAFVRQRALEREQARVEALQSRLLEKQRLRREVRYLRYLEAERVAKIEAAALKAEQDKQKRLEEVQRAKEAAEQIEREKREAAAKIAAEKRAAEERIAEERRAREREIIRSRDALRREDSSDSDSNQTDDALLADPLAPIPETGDIFEDLDLGLGN